MDALARLFRLLAARWVGVYLMLAYIAFLILLAAWGVLVPTPVLRNIAAMVPFWLLYLLAGLHLLCCTIQFGAALRRRVSLERPEGLEAGTPAEVRLDAGLERAARGAGMRLRWLEQGRCAVLFRRRWAPAGTLLFHVALLLLPLAFAVSQATRFEGQAWIVEGHPFGGTEAEYTRTEPPGAFARRAPRVQLDVEEVSATFWGDRLFFTDLRALVASRDDGQARWITMPQPLWQDGARISIRGFNFTPTFELVGPRGRVLRAADLNLKLFPPGTEDSFALPGLPHRIWVRLYPDSAGPGARPLNRGLDLKRPLLHVAVTRGKRLVTHGWLRPGEPLAFDGYRITFPAVREGGEILVHRDWGYPVLWAALILALLGSLLRVAFPASRVWLAAGPGGGTRALAREDAFAGGRAAALIRAWSRDAD